MIFLCAIRIHCVQHFYCARIQRVIVLLELSMQINNALILKFKIYNLKVKSFPLVCHEKKPPKQIQITKLQMKL